MKVAKIYYKGVFVDEVNFDGLDPIESDLWALYLTTLDDKKKVVCLVPKDHLIILKEDSRIAANFKSGFEKYDEQKLDKKTSR